MSSFHRFEFCAGLLLLLAPAEGAGARESLQEESDVLVQSNYLDGPNVLEGMIQDEEHAASPTVVSGSYLAGLVVHQEVRASWVQSDIGIQLFLEGEKLDPRRYQIDWKVTVSPYSVAKARFVGANTVDFGQKIQIETPLNSLNGRLIGAIEIEARVSDREQPEKAPEVIVQTLRDMLANGRDGL